MSHPFPPRHEAAGASASPGASAGNSSVGFLAVIAAAMTSGFASVYQEAILQGTPTSVWIRNIQMGLPSVAIAWLSTFAKDGAAIRERGFFQGYSLLVCFVVLLQGVGGLNVAFILKYAGSILKGFAAAFSTLSSGVVEVALFGFRPTASFLLGAVLINAATYAYSSAPASPGLSGLAGTPKHQRSRSDLSIDLAPDSKSPDPSPRDAEAGGARRRADTTDSNPA